MIKIIAGYVEMKCPFCDGTINPGNIMVLHSIPYCKTFEDSDDALDFVMRCNEKIRSVGNATS